MRISVNGRAVETAEGCSVAAVLLQTEEPGFTPMCGMGICMQCRATVDGTPLVRTCQLPCREGMRVETT